MSDLEPIQCPRFWTAQTDSPAPLDQGFLMDPEEFDYPRSKGVLRIEDVSHVPCVILLGEPGIGKSTVLRETYCQSSPDDTDGSLWVDFGAIGSEDGLQRKLFQNQEFLDWAKSDRRLTLYLDGLDEALIRLDHLQKLLLEELSPCPIDRLFLRVACRTAVWSEFLESGLRKIWSNGESEATFKVLQMAPLRIIDAEQILAHSGIESKETINALVNKDLGALFNKPIMLNLLVRILQNEGAIPEARRQIYEMGCLELCAESKSDTYPTSAKTLSAAQRMLIAGRLAALSILAKRSGIEIGPEHAVQDFDTLHIQSAIGGPERHGSGQFTVEQAQILETVRHTGLFAERGDNTLRWTHQSYPEFLAAWYLNHWEVGLEQLLDLFASADGKIVPQLRECAGWLASMNQEFARELLSREPLAMLLTDSAELEDSEKKILIDSLFQLVRDEEITYLPTHRSASYPIMQHPGVAAQLLGYATDKNERPIIRHDAIDLICALELNQLSEELKGIVTDTHEANFVRVAACDSLHRLSGPECVEFLKGLLGPNMPEDVDDELRGTLLNILYPDHISTSQLMDALTPPKDENLTGMYRMFLLHPPCIPAEDMQEALNWLKQLSGVGAIPRDFRELSKSILATALNSIDGLNLYRPLAESLIALYEESDFILHQTIQEISKACWSEENRRRLACAVVSLSGPPHDHRSGLGMARAILSAGDTGWVLDKIEEQDKSNHAKWVWILHRIFDLREARTVIRIIDLAVEDTVLQSELTWWLTPVVLGSDHAKDGKKEYNKRMNGKKGEETKQNYGQQIQDAIREQSVDSWFRVYHLIELDNKQETANEIPCPCVEHTSFWQRCSADEKAALIAKAFTFIRKYKPQASRWIGTQSSNIRDCYAFRTLEFLCSVNGAVVENLDAEFWKEWVHLVVAYPFSNMASEKAIQKKLCELAHCNHPDIFVSAISGFVGAQCIDHDYCELEVRLSEELSTEITDVLLATVANEKLNGRARGQVLQFLLDKNAHGAIEFVESLFSTLSHDHSDDFPIEAAIAYVSSRPESAFELFWPILESHSEWTRAFILRLARVLNFHTLKDLSLENRCRLFIWLSQVFPVALDPDIGDAHFVSDREEVQRLRESVLRGIAEQGSLEALEALLKIETIGMPSQWTLQDALRTCKERYRELSWEPPTTAQILQLLGDSSNRYIQNESQLSTLVMSCLATFESGLHCTTPMIEAVWDRTDKNEKIYRPKDENTFRNIVANSLKERLAENGAILNREVEIHLLERTDILVEAVVPDGEGEWRDKLSVVVEVKGCWHKELDVAMNKQLLQRYLANNTCTHGIYLVAWYLCERWDENDSRHRTMLAKFRAMSLNDARDHFAQQAADLTSDSKQLSAFIMDCRM